jgi:nitrogen PTS system EIIA component
VLEIRLFQRVRCIFCKVLKIITIHLEATVSMDLQIHEVAKWLNVTEDTLREWVVNKQIPSYHIGNRYRFCRTEIENWMMCQPIFSTSLQKGEGVQQFNMYRAIYKGTVLYNVPGTTKEEVIRNTMKETSSLLQFDADIITDLLLDRESLMATALNNGIGAPHTRDTLIKAPHDSLILVFPKTPLLYGALDGQPVDILFFIFACEDKRHLQLLAKIAHFSHQPQALAFMRTHPTKEAILTYIKEWESSLSA